jgi:hypothetical protein
MTPPRSMAACGGSASTTMASAFTVTADWSTTTTPRPLHPAEHQLLRGLPQCCVFRRHAPLGQIVGELVERAGGASRQNGAALVHLAARRKDDLARRR